MNFQVQFAHNRNALIAIQPFSMSSTFSRLVASLAAASLIYFCGMPAVFSEEQNDYAMQSTVSPDADIDEGIGLEQELQNVRTELIQTRTEHFSTRRQIEENDPVAIKLREDIYRLRNELHEKNAELDKFIRGSEIISNLVFKEESLLRRIDEIGAELRAK